MSKDSLNSTPQSNHNIAGDHSWHWSPDSFSRPLKSAFLQLARRNLLSRSVPQILTSTHSCVFAVLPFHLVDSKHNVTPVPVTLLILFYQIMYYKQLHSRNLPQHLLYIDTTIPSLPCYCEQNMSNCSISISYSEEKMAWKDNPRLNCNNTVTL